MTVFIEPKIQRSVYQDQVFELYEKVKTLTGRKPVLGQSEQDFIVGQLIKLRENDVVRARKIIYSLKSFSFSAAIHFIARDLGFDIQESLKEHDWVAKEGGALPYIIRNFDALFAPKSAVDAQEYSSVDDDTDSMFDDDTPSVDLNSGSCFASLNGIYDDRI